MGTNRLEAFSDGVIAILMTIMVLELRAPAGAGLADLRHVLPSLLWYLLSFVFLGIYWSNHHHMLAVVKHVNGWVLWANLHLLFWLSLVPFTTDWLGSYHGRVPTLCYGGVLLASGIAYLILQETLLRLEGPDSALANAVGRDRKGRVSLALYAAAVIAAYFSPPVADGLFVLVSVIWFVPDRRIESRVPHGSPE